MLVNTQLKSTQSSSIAQKILHGVTSAFLLTLVTTLLALFQFRLVFVFLNYQVAGICFLFLTIGAYITFFDMGLNPTIGRELSLLTGANDINETRTHTGIVNLATTCGRLVQILAGLAFLLSLLLGHFFFQSIAPNIDHAVINIAWGIFALGCSFDIVSGANLAMLYGMGNVASERLTRTLALIAGFICMLVFLKLGFGIIGLSLAWLIQKIISIIVAKYLLNKNFPFFREIKGVKFQQNIAKKIVMPSLKWAAMGFGAILILQTDNIVIAEMIGTQAIPNYAAVAKITTLLMTLSLMLSNSSTPFLSGLFAADNFEQFNVLMLRNVRYGMALMIALVAFIGVYGDMVTNVWLGKGHFVGFPVLWTLLVMTLLEVHHVILASATMATGKIVFAPMALLAGILNIVFSVLFVNYLGLWGVALGTMVAQILTNNWYAPYVTLKLFKIKFGDYFLKVFMPVLVVLAMSLLANTLLRQYVQLVNGLSTLIISAFISFLISAVFASVLLLTASERKALLSVVRNA